MASSQPGAGDPYWYEWFVGLDRVIDFLLPEGNIESVTFQHPDLEGIDDVVVRFKDGRPPCCYQVKHSRIEESGQTNITFSVLVAKGETGKSLIGTLASGWKTFRRTQNVAPTVVLYSNRALGTMPSSACFAGKRYKRKPLGVFLDQLSAMLANLKPGELPSFSNHDDKVQFCELLDAVGLETIEDSISFLKSFRVDSSKPSLSDAKRCLIRRLEEEICAGKSELASLCFDRLCSELSNWTTSGGSNVVTRKTAIECFAKLNEHKINRNVIVAVPDPVFPSRAALSRSIAQKIISSEKPVIFISGAPGAGKTRLVSCIFEVLKSEVKASRFYAFEPLDVDDFSYSPDRGVVDARSMWSTFINQLRQQVYNPYAEISIPVINDLCSDNELRAETMRLAALSAAQFDTETVLFIDGIDHAARAENQLTFLSHLPAPDMIPAGVKIVIAGQPKEGYPSYPAWLRVQTPFVDEINIPNLVIQDVVCLLRNKSRLSESDIGVVAARIMSLTLGNTISVVYGVSSVSECDDTQSALDVLDKSGLSSNIEEYYSSIWKSAELIENKSDSLQNPLDILACVAHCFDGLIDPKAISEAFPDVFSESYLVDKSLIPLKPLFRCGLDGIYRPLHNDFRLYVSRHATAAVMKPCMKYVVDKLADYILQTNQGILRSCFGIRVLTAANRINDCLNLFDTDFVISAVSHGAPWDLMEEQATIVYDMACKSCDLLAVQRVQSAIATLSQIDEHINYYEESYPNTHDRSLNAFDVIRVPLDSDHIYAYKTALERILWLKASDSNDAAKEMFEVWFGSYTPYTFCSCLTENNSSFYRIGNAVSELMFQWGCFAAQSNLEYDELDVNYDVVQAFESQCRSFRDGYIIEKLKSVSTPEDAQDFISVFRPSLEAVKSSLKDYLCGKNPITSVALSCIASKLVSRSSDFWSLAIQYAATALSDGAAIDLSYIKEKLLCERRFYYDSDTTAPLIAECFVYGFCCSCQGFAATCAAAESELNWLDSADFDYQQLILRARASVCLGYSAAHSTSIEKGTPESQCIEHYLTNRRGRTFDFFDSDLLLQYMINAGYATQLSDDAISDDALESFVLSARSFSIVKLRLVKRLVQSGKITILQKVIDEYYGNDGSVLLTKEEAPLLHSLLKGAVEIVNPDLAKKVDLAVPAMISGITDHKDYSLNHLVKLFELGVSGGSIAPSAAQRLQNIDAAASKVGSNRVSDEIKDALFDWSLSRDVSEFYKIRNHDIELKYDYSLLWRQFRPLLSFARTADEILACFAVVYGFSSYYDFGDLSQIREAAKRCCDSAQLLGCIEKVEAAISAITEHLPERVYTQLENSKDEFMDSYREKEAAKRDAVSGLKDEELPWVAYDELFEGWDWARAFFACEEMISRGRHAVDVYEKLTEERVVELSQGGWERTSSSCEMMIKRISALVSDEVFFRFLSSRKDNLCQYGFGTASTDIAFAIRERIASHFEYDINEFFDVEYESKSRWLTANRALELPELKEVENLELGTIDDGEGIDLLSVCTDILIDLLVESDPHRAEDAVRGLAWLGVSVPASCIRIYERFNELTPGSKVLVLKLADYWFRLGSAEAESFLESILVTTESLSELMLVCVALGKLPPRFNAIDARQGLGSRIYVNDIPSRIARFLDDADALGDDCSDIRQEIEQSSDYDWSQVSVRSYMRREDVFYPINTIEGLAEEIMYREYSVGRWAYCSIPMLAARLIDPSDVWIMSTLPIYKDAEEYGVNGIITAFENNQSEQAASLVANLSRVLLNTREDLLGWKVYIPFSTVQEYEVFETVRIVKSTLPIRPEITDYALGCYGLIARDLGANQSSFDKSRCSVPLFCVLGGCISMTWCDAQIVPTDVLYQLGLMPRVDNPLVWVNDSDVPVIWFERLVFLIDYGFNNKAYYRQPQIWRWVCNSQALDELLTANDCELYRVRNERKGDDPMHENYVRGVVESLASPFGND